MRSADLVRVGIAVIVGLAILIGASFWLRRAGVSGKTSVYRVKFVNAQGIQKGAYVRVGGVTVGEVTSVDLIKDPLPAQLTLKISKAYEVKPEDSIRIVAGRTGFSPPYVEITPGGRKKPAAAGPENVFTGESGSGTEELISEADRLLHNLNNLSESMTRLS